MIDEKKLIEVCRENSTPDGNIFIENLEDWIAEMPKVGEWIPVSERLPRDDKYILLSFENFTIPQIGRYETDDDGGAFYIGDDDKTCVQQDLFVNAWMPLPEPWEVKK